MRLGGMLFRTEDPAGLDELLPKLDTHGLSAIPAPKALVELTDDAAAEFGRRARSHGLVIGEATFLANLMTTDESLRRERIASLRVTLQKADVMGCRSVVILVGTRDPSDRLAAPHPYMFTEDCEREFADVVLAVLDKLDLRTTRLLVEPWNNTFFYQPRRIHDFLARTDHPALGLHLDQMNMVDQWRYYRTTELIEETFDLLAGYVGSVHLKDIRWDFEHMFLKLDEVLIGDGVLDYATYLPRISKLDEDITCYCEHLATEEEYATNFERLHRLAADLGLAFVPRTPPDF